MNGRERRHTAVVAAAFILCGIGGAADEASEQERDLDAVIAEILAGPDDADYSETRRCIVSGRIDRTEVLSDRFVVFHLRGGKKYVVQFKRRCPGLRRNGLTRIERRSSHICANDTIQGLFGGLDGGTWGPRCMIPQFEPVTKEQITFIEETLKAR